MSEERDPTLAKHVVWSVNFWIAFIVIKTTGTSLAAWSWWWVLMPSVPLMWLAFGKLGLL